MNRFILDPDNMPLRRPGVYLILHVETQRGYVGISQNLAKRIQDHARGESPRKFLNALKKYGTAAFAVIPLYYSLSSETDMLPEIEVDLIRAYATSGTTGFNVLLGKGGVGPYSAEYAASVSVRFKALYGDEAWATARKAKLREDALARWADPAMRAMMLERSKAGTDRPETRAKLAVATAKQWENPETRAVMVAGIKATLATPEAKARKTTPEHLAHMRAMGAAGRANPEVMARRTASQKAAANTPERLAGYSRLAKEMWADPEKRAQHIASRRKRWSDPDARAAVSARMKCHDLKWITDGVSVQRIKGADPLPEGWQYGRGPSATRATIWINNGVKNRRIPFSEPIPAGWQAGNLSKGKPKPRKSV